ncbi:hypothetical protein C5167_038311 [Papaver somniferum]|uniref:Uncharacterized protein n=1 Tax=Papaver somniferum TaxID=3469 RepID=A0A4Y7IC34_PAPSO|nr:hypothetical protein C5167_038311 [Papaver somniferum]
MNGKMTLAHVAIAQGISVCQHEDTVRIPRELWVSVDQCGPLLMMSLLPSDPVNGRFSAVIANIVATPNDVFDDELLIFVFFTEFRIMEARCKGVLWRTQSLDVKPTAMFYSTGSQGGGQERIADKFSRCSDRKATLLLVVEFTRLMKLDGLSSDKGYGAL